MEQVVRGPAGYRPCVGIMVFNRDGLVWAGRRAGASSDAERPGGWWQMPQGGIDAGEEPPRAALRELHEETNITSARIVAELADWHHYDLPSHLIGKAWGGRYRGQRQKWFAVRFEGADGEIDIARPGHKREFLEWRWVAIGDLLDLVVPFKRTVYAAVVREFAGLAIPG